MDEVEGAGLVRTADRVDLLSNRLVVVVPAGRAAPVRRRPRTWPACGAWPSATPRRCRPASTPGSGSRGAASGSALRERVVPTLDVRAALAAVESGQRRRRDRLRTDAAISKRVRVALEVPAARGPAHRLPGGAPRRRRAGPRPGPSSTPAFARGARGVRAARVRVPAGGSADGRRGSAGRRVHAADGGHGHGRWCSCRASPPRSSSPGYRGPGRGALETLLSLPLVLPPTAVGLALLELLGRNRPLGGWLAARGVEVVFTWKAVVLATAVMSFPLLVRSARTAFEEVDPRLVGLARTLGCGPASPSSASRCPSPGAASSPAPCSRSPARSASSARRSWSPATSRAARRRSRSRSSTRRRSAATSAPSRSPAWTVALAFAALWVDGVAASAGGARPEAA